MTKREFFIGVGMSVVGGVFMLVAANINDGLLSLGAKANNAANQATVVALQSQVEKLPTRDDLREFTAQMRQFNQQMADIRSDIRLAKSERDSLGTTVSGLISRQRYLWDSVTQLCTHEDIACATQNASARGVPPMPAPGTAYLARTAIRDKRWRNDWQDLASMQL